MISLDKNNSIETGQNPSFNKDLTKIIFDGSENKLIIGDNFKVDSNITILVKGDNNEIFIGNDFESNGQIMCVINGNNNTIQLGNNMKVSGYLNIDLSQNSENCFLTLGDNAVINKASFQEHGTFNEISIGNNLEIKEIFIIAMAGDQNKAILGNNIGTNFYFSINMLERGLNRYVSIGDFTTFYKTEIQNYDIGSSVIIGKDCMFSHGTIVYNTDGHAIFQDGKLINKAETCRIGDHVWLGWDVTVLKNSQIPDGTIVARNALVCKSFDEKNTIIAGIPAKVVKHNIEWSRKTINEALEMLDNQAVTI